MSAPVWTQIRVRVGREAVEAVANFLLELGSPGLEVEQEGETATLKGYLRGDAGRGQQELSRYLQSLKAMGLTQCLEGPELSALPESDWLSVWRSRFHAFRVGRRLLIKPSWETVNATARKLVISIDPQMAFGTGEHATTQLCLRALEDLVQKDDFVLDVGTGSGILSIAAVKLGAEMALGLDIEPEAIATARENARINGVSHRVEFSCSPLDRSVPSKSFHRVVANITSQVLLPLLPDLKRVLIPHGDIILAGFLVEEDRLLRRAFSENGLHIRQLKRQRGWISVVATGQEI